MSKQLEQLESFVDQKEVIVIDCGTESIKIGYSGEDQPRIELESRGGTFSIKDETDSIQSKKQTHLFGPALKTALRENKHEVALSPLLTRSQINNYEFMGNFWEYVLDSLLQCSEITAANLLIVENAASAKENKQEVARVLFEQVKVQSLLFMNSANASLLSTGQTTGLVVESGAGTSNVTPIFEGYPIYHAQNISQLAGQDVTQCLAHELSTLENFDPSRLGKTEAERAEVVKSIKEVLCETSLNYHYDLHSRGALDTEEKSYELPDGSILEVDKTVKYKPAEIMFDPSLIDSTQNSIGYMLKDSLERCDNELVTELLKQVVICGGNSHLVNFPQRVKQELMQHVPPIYEPSDVVYNVESHRKYNSWVGASMVGSLSTFQHLAIQKTEYDENPEGKLTIIQKKTF